MSRLGAIGAIGGRLYRGEVSFDFVGRQKLWYTISGAILVIAILALAFRGLHYSVEFTGGDLFKFNANGVSTSQIASVVKDAGGGDDAVVQQLGVASQHAWQVQTAKLTQGQQGAVQAALASKLHVSGGTNSVSVNFTSASWGASITHRAFEGLLVFLALIVIYLSIAFEWKMAVAAFVALIHDIVITTGVYALAGFQVSPATVIGLLTILGYSLYDTVVVFDKVRENTAGLLATQRSTYSQASNLALNQTLVRSINTSLIALLPVTAILVVAVTYLGTGELQDLSLVLFVGMLSGTYSSICIATPVLSGLKEREPQFKQLAKRVALRDSGGRAAQRAKARAEKADRAAGRRGQVAPDALAPDAGDASEGQAVTGRGPGVSPGSEPATSAELTDDYSGAGEDTDGAAPGEPVGAARAAGGSSPRGGPGPRPGPRQQPRRSGGARRRPAGKKKRR
ncbi:MAG TPA: protein translocase subunit SecF [Streptosporangiaceae bacterium]|nr:protein translocase subunit SecF [Streptosporangiaceae bacterium]